MKLILSLFLTGLIYYSNAQSFITKDLKYFGAKGDGKTNDQAAFKKASDYFNKRGGFGKLVINKGTYIVGTQIFTGGQLNKPAYLGENILEFISIENFSVEGQAGAIIKYKSNQRIGAFSPSTGKVYEHGNTYFVDAIGAGDSFNAGFISSFLQGKSLRDCLKFGNLAGAVNTTAPGGTAAFSDRSSFIATAKTIFNIEI